MKLFQHYKGDFYILIGVADNSTNDQNDKNRYAIYKSLVRDEIHIREIEEFFGYVGDRRRFKEIFAPQDVVRRND